MADSFDVSVDDGGLSALFKEMGDDLVKKVPRVVNKAALNIKKTMQVDAAKSRHFRMAKDIGYDHWSIDATGLSAQIGPQSRGAGNLAHIAYFGGAHGGGGTVRDPQRAADEEMPRFERALLNIVDGLL